MKSCRSSVIVVITLVLTVAIATTSWFAYDAIKSQRESEQRVIFTSNNEMIRLGISGSVNGFLLEAQVAVKAMSSLYNASDAASLQAIGDLIVEKTRFEVFNTLLARRVFDEPVADVAQHITRMHYGPSQPTLPPVVFNASGAVIRTPPVTPWVQHLAVSVSPRRPTDVLARRVGIRDVGPELRFIFGDSLPTTLASPVGVIRTFVSGSAERQVFIVATVYELGYMMSLQINAESLLNQFVIADASMSYTVHFNDLLDTQIQFGPPPHGRFTDTFNITFPFARWTVVSESTAQLNKNMEGDINTIFIGIALALCVTVVVVGFLALYLTNVIHAKDVQDSKMIGLYTSSYISHEMRTVLLRILSAINRLPPEDPVSLQVRKNTAEGNKLLNDSLLMKDVLSVSFRPMLDESVDLVAFLHSIIEDHDVLMPQTMTVQVVGVDIQGGIHCKMSARHVNQILTNHITNAIKYTAKPTDNIRVLYTVKDEHLMVAVYTHSVLNPAVRDKDNENLAGSKEALSVSIERLLHKRFAHLQSKEHVVKWRLIRCLHESLAGITAQDGVIIRGKAGKREVKSSGLGYTFSRMLAYALGGISMLEQLHTDVAVGWCAIPVSVVVESIV